MAVAYHHQFYRSAVHCDPPGEAILPPDLAQERSLAVGCAFDLLGHQAGPDDWPIGLISMVEGIHQRYWLVRTPWSVISMGNDTYTELRGIFPIRDLKPDPYLKPDLFGRWF